MNQPDVKNCPDATILEDFLLGRLEPPTLSECESHVAECQSCHETLRGLNSHDTLSEHVAGAFLGSDSFLTEAEDSEQVHGLVDRLLEQTGSNAPPRSHGPKLSATEAEILADRAAEVLRCVTPADDDQKTLGSIGDYQLIRLLGSGSTGVVFQAIDQKLDRTVALKVLRPSLGSVARDRFIAEARLAASIEHPNVVTIYQVGQHDRLAFIAMQWLPGETLEAKLNATVTMDEADVRSISAQVAAGLQAAHDRQLVHRDIKPANVWISDESEEVKILDFGLARIVDDDPGLTATGMLAGTPNFMSPEQTKGHELDGRSDLFSLGCMMYRMATGKLAFGATSILGTLQAIQHEQPTPPKRVNAEISDDLSDLTMSLLEKQPANRPESASQFMTMLKTDRKEWPIQVGSYDAPASNIAHQANPKPGDGGHTGSGRSRWYRRIAAVIATGLIGAAAFLFSPQIIRIATDQGELVVESEDKDVEVQILQDGNVIRVLDTKTKNSFNIESGDYQIKATGEESSFEVTPDQLTMKRGQQAIVVVTERPNGGERANPDELSMRSGGQEVPKELPDLFGGPVVADAPILKKYAVTTDLELAINVVQTMLEGHDSVRISIDAKTGSLIVLGNEDDHQLVSKTLATLSAPPENNSGGLLDLFLSADNKSGEASSKPPASNQPTFKGKPFSHWINITKTERSTDMLCDALRAGAELATTKEEKARLLEVVRALARNHGTTKLGADAELDQYHKALISAMKAFDPPEIIQFVLDELENGTVQSVGFSSWLVNHDSYRMVGGAGTVWKNGLNAALVERAHTLLRLVVAQLDGGGPESVNRSAMLRNVIAALTGKTRKWDRVGDSDRFYTRGWSYHSYDDEHVAWAKEKNAELAPAIRQLFIDGAPTTKHDLIRLTRNLFPNDVEIERSLQSALFNQSTPVKTRDLLYALIMGANPGHPTSQQGPPFSPKPIAVRFLKKLLDNQLGPENQRIVVVDSVSIRASDQIVVRDPNIRRIRTRRINGRGATICHILGAAVFFLHEQPAEDEAAPLSEILEQIVEVVDSDDPKVKQEWDNFRSLKIFDEAKQLLAGSERPETKKKEIDSKRRVTNLSTFKGKPFTHWINVTKTERSTEMLCDALRAGSELATTKEEKAQLLEVTRTIARKHGREKPHPGSDSEKYHKALAKAIRAFDPPEVIQFMLDELEHGTEESVLFCSTAMRYASYDLDQQSAELRYRSLSPAFVERTPQLLRLIVKRLEDGMSAAESVFLKELGERLVGLRMKGVRPGVKRWIYRQSSVDTLNERNKELAPTIKQLFLDSSTSTKLELIHLTRAICNNDEEVEQALSAELFNLSTKPETRDQIYETLDGRQKPMPSSVLFLKKLLDNQLGPDEQRVKFSDLEEVYLDQGLSGPFIFADQGMSRGTRMGKNPHYRSTSGETELPKTISGRSAVIYELLVSLEWLTRAPVKLRDKRLVEPEAITPILKQIMSIKDSEDPTMKATVDELDELLVFENAAWVLGRIEEQR